MHIIPDDDDLAITRCQIGRSDARPAQGAGGPDHLAIRFLAQLPALPVWLTGVRLDTAFEGIEPSKESTCER